MENRIHTIFGSLLLLGIVVCIFSLSIAGDVKADEVKALAEKYFGDIPSGPPVDRHQVWIARHVQDIWQVTHGVHDIHAIRECVRSSLLIPLGAPREGTCEHQENADSRDELSGHDDSLLITGLMVLQYHQIDTTLLFCSVIASQKCRS